MLDNLTNDDVFAAINELTEMFGVKEPQTYHDLLAMLGKNETQRCVQEIVTRLGLPIRIELSYVSKDFKPNSSDGFRTSALVKTDWSGRGTSSVTAQVSIPQHLPMFGSSALNGFPIRVRVSENCYEHPETFVSVMAHELSHVLLASLHHPQKDSELHTDLVPILLGFGNVVRLGRKTVDSTSLGNTTTTHTTTYGYLTDSQFEFAYNHVTTFLNRQHGEKEHLAKVVKRIRLRIKKAAHSLTTFRDYMAYLDNCLPARMRKEHAQRIVQLHQHDYSADWEGTIKEVKTQTDRLEAFVLAVSHYTNNAVGQLKNHALSLKSSLEQIERVAMEIEKDKTMLRHHVSLTHQLKRAIQGRLRSV